MLGACRLAGRFSAAGQAGIEPVCKASAGEFELEPGQLGDRALAEIEHHAAAIPGSDVPRIPSQPSWTPLPMTTRS